MPGNSTNLQIILVGILCSTKFKALIVSWSELLLSNWAQNKITPTVT